MDARMHCYQYIEALRTALSSLPLDDIEKGVEILWNCQRQGGTIFTMGNGGHCNTASHAINDLAKHTISSDDKTAVIADKYRFKAMCLNDRTYAVG